MKNHIITSIEESFKDLKDLRKETLNKEHNFLDIIVIAICGMICNANNFVAMEQFGNAKKEWFQKFLNLPNGIPSHDTFNNVFSKLSPDEFEACFLSWASGLRTIFEGEHIVIDGKTVRRSCDKSKGNAAIHVVSAWASLNSIVLGQLKTDEKSNEITAIPELLKVLNLKGCLVSIDAMGCQSAIAETIIEKEADYVLALKANQPKLHESVTAYFESAAETEFEGCTIDVAQTQEKSHGRKEVRRAFVSNETEKIRHGKEWENIKTIAKIESERTVKDKKESHCRYYISSAKLSAKDILTVVRRYWEIENSLHWYLDVSFREDESRIWEKNGAENVAILRRIALNLLKQEKTAKVGIETKRLMAGWNEAYLIKLLNAFQT